MQFGGSPDSRDVLVTVDNLQCLVCSSQCTVYRVIQNDQQKVNLFFAKTMYIYLFSGIDFHNNTWYHLIITPHWCPVFQIFSQFALELYGRVFPSPLNLKSVPFFGGKTEKL